MMQEVFGFDEVTLVQLLLELVWSFQVEVCLFGAAVLCFQFLHGGLLESIQKDKASPSKKHKLRDAAAYVEAPAKDSAEPDYSEMIKACAKARNLERAREIWSEMAAKQRTDKAALRSMVEALVAQGCTVEAWELANREWEESELEQDQIHIYSALLRGFAKAPQHSDVCALYREMRERQVPMNTITFNIVLNSMARLGRMHLVPEFLEVMRAEGPRGAPDTVTFSTIINGYCHNSDVDAALKLFDLMLETEIKPDEFMFNSLLDGCAKHRRLKEALRVLDIMQEQGVPLSNCTLSIAMKVLGRAHRLGQAFDLVDRMSKTHGLRPNIQVYTCLMQACFQGRRIRKAFDLYNRVVAEGLAAIDAKVFTALVRGCLSCGAAEKAAMVVRAAYGLPSCGTLLAPEGRPQGTSPECIEEVLAELRRKDPAEAEALEAELAACVPPPRRRKH